MSQVVIDQRAKIREEYKKCIADPIYFIKKFVKIQHPIRGTIAFDLFEFQESTIKDLAEYDKNIILKSRQMGISTLVAAYSLWLMTFHEDKNILCISITQETAKEIVTKVRFANDNLPIWLKVPCTEDNRLSLKLKNGSQIKAVSSAGTAGRSSALSLLVIDEAAFIDGIEDIWLSAQFTLSTGGSCVILSTPNGAGNFFHKTWVEAEAGKNTFNTIKLPWNLHPERDQAWRDKQTEISGVKGASQECDTEFATSGNQVIDPLIVDFYKTTYIKDPKEKRGMQQDFWLWAYPDSSKDYIVSADCGRGDGGDNSAFHVLDVETLEQVAEYQGQVSTRDYGNLLVAIATEYNNALLIVDNQNVGEGAIQQIIDRGYPNLFHSSPDLTLVDVESSYTSKFNTQEKKMTPGFTTTRKNRPLMISKLELLFREKSIIIHSNRLIEELNVFIWNNGKAEAMRGYKDDLVLSICMAIWVRDTALKLRNDHIIYNKLMLSGIKKVTSTISPSTKNMQMKSDPQKQWEFNVGNHMGGTKESLTWLLK